MAVQAVRAALRQMNRGVATPSRHSLRAGLAPYLARATFVVIVCATVVGCASDNGPDSESGPDIESARTFDGFPLYWLGETFEGLEVTTIIDTVATPNRVSIIYGSCKPSGTFEPTCALPLQIQIVPLCFHLDAVALPPRPQARQVRGAPVGGQDGAPVLLTRKTQIKIYRGEGTDRGISLRALHALRSLNAVEPVISPTDVIPSPPPGVLSGSRPCPE